MFGYIATEAAYRGGTGWLKGVLKQIYTNYEVLRDTLIERFSKIIITPLEGTYLMRIDLGAYLPHRELRRVVQGSCRLAVDYGDWFRPEGEDTHIRINLATTYDRVKLVAERLAKGIAAYVESGAKPLK